MTPQNQQPALHLAGSILLSSGSEGSCVSTACDVPIGGMTIYREHSGICGHCRATQLLTWFMIPFSQGFDDAGDFTILGR